jgi:hypothetical protein
MSGILRIEFQRAFKNPRLWLIPVLALVSFWVGYQQISADFILEGATRNTYRLWMLWYSNTFFIYLAPLLAAIPYSDSLITDRRYGFLKNILVRCRFSHYMTAKIVANMAVGALAVSLPEALNIAYSFLVVKINAPILAIGSSQMSFPNTPMGALGYLFSYHPWLYLAFLIALAGIFGAAYATFGLAVSAWVDNPYVAMAAPFAFVVVMGYLAERSLKLAIIGHPAGAFLPFRFSLGGVQIIAQYLALALAFLFSFALYARRARNQRLA